MNPMDKAAGISFLISGALLTAWGMFSILGTLMGGVMGVAGIAQGDEEAILGIGIFLIYGFWMAVCLIVGPIQLIEGTRRMLDKPKGILMWVATIGSLLATSTVYCALPAILSFGLGLASVLAKPEAPAEPAEA